MESIEKMVGNNNGSFPDGGNIFIEPEKKGWSAARRNIVRRRLVYSAKRAVKCMELVPSPDIS